MPAVLRRERERERGLQVLLGFGVPAQARQGQGEAPAGLRLASLINVSELEGQGALEVRDRRDRLIEDELGEAERGERIGYAARVGERLADGESGIEERGGFGGITQGEVGNREVVLNKGFAPPVAGGADERKRKSEVGEGRLPVAEGVFKDTKVT